MLYEGLTYIQFRPCIHWALSGLILGSRQQPRLEINVQRFYSKVLIFDHYLPHKYPVIRHLFKVNKKDSRITPKDVALVSFLLTLERYF